MNDRRVRVQIDKDREKVLKEPVFRAPPALNAFTALSHYVFASQSAENTFFDNVCTPRPSNDSTTSDRNPSLGTLQEETDSPHDKHIIPFIVWLEDKIIPSNACPHRGTLLGDNDGLLTLSSLKNLTDMYAFEMRDQTEASHIRNAANEIHRCFKQIIETRPELFLFGCYSHIAILINHKLFEIAPTFKAREDDVQLLIRQLFYLLDSNRETIRRMINMRVNDVQKVKLAYRPNLGGLIDLLKRKAGYKPDPNLFEEDVIFLDMPYDTRYPHYHHRIRWQRAILYWNYTFFESPMPMATNILNSPNTDIPNLPLGEQTDDCLAEYKGKLGAFVATILNMQMRPSITQSPAIADIITSEGARNFPGRFLACAHYTFIPFGILVALIFFPRYCLNLSHTIINQVRRSDTLDENLGSTTKWPEDNEFAEIRDCFVCHLEKARKNKEYVDFILMLKKYGMNDLANSCSNLNVEPNIKQLLTLGWSIFGLSVICVQKVPLRKIS